jgi:hypothetical protein
VFERAKTVHAFWRAATVIGFKTICHTQMTSEVLKLMLEINIPHSVWCGEE